MSCYYYYYNLYFMFIYFYIIIAIKQNINGHFVSIQSKYKMHLYVIN